MIVAAANALQVGLVVAGLLAVAGFVYASSRPGARTRHHHAARPEPHEPPASTTLRASRAEERRVAGRVAIIRPVVLTRSGSQSRTFAINISATGLLLAGPSDLDIGERVSVAVELADGESMVADGSVVRTSTQGYRGVRFEQMDDAGRRALSAHLAAA